MIENNQGDYQYINAGVWEHYVEDSYLLNILREGVFMPLKYLMGITI